MIIIRNISNSHLQETAKIHLRAFPDSALTKLGEEAIRRYYLWQLTGPHDCLAIGAFDQDDHMVGFCFGGIFRGALSGFVRQNRRFLVLQVLSRPWLIITNSIFRDRLRLGLRAVRRQNSQVGKIQETIERPFGILSIAVDPSTQGQGVGQIMMKHSEDFARRNGFTQMRLSVAVDNQQAIFFYLKLGWKKEIVGANWNGAMLKDL